MHIRCTLFRLFESGQVIVRYWRNFSFLKVDLALLLQYWNLNPYRLLKSRAPYGETPLSTMDRIARMCRILSDDRVVDLGSGRGRVIFWLACHVKCRAVGIDENPLFIKRARSVKKWYNEDRVDFLHGDFTTMNFSDATVVYLYGSAFSDEDIHKIGAHLRHLREGTRIITVSYSLNEIGIGGFPLIKSFEASFPWGKTIVYLQRVK